MLRWAASLDADAELDVRELVAGVGVEVVRGAAIELVALTDLAPDDEAEGNGSERRGDPTESHEQAGGLLRCGGLGELLVWLILRGSIASRACGALGSVQEPHGKHDSAGALWKAAI